jgi:cyclohexanone monooxygenase/acetone monooxygenase
MTTCLQQQTEWINNCIQYMRDHQLEVIEPSRQLEDKWVAHHDETAAATLISRTNSWYTGSNVPGKPRRVLSYTGGVGPYREKCDEATHSEYSGFIKA